MYKPTKEMLDYLEREVGVFFHFGVRTFNEDNRDWDGSVMSAESFNPTALDCREWLRSVKEAGASYAILTTKHHDGFALWQSKYTDFGVKNSPWKDGKGDVVKEFTDACREYGVKVGLYYSCAQQGAKALTSEEYNDFVVGQLNELFGGAYGDIDELWFDACGSEGYDFDGERIERTLRELQPKALIFGSWGDDIAWVGNECGFAQLNNTNNTATNGVPRFRPVECDCTMVRKGDENFWFFSETNKSLTRTSDEIVGLYLNSVGRGANLLINLAPDRRGLLRENEVEILTAALSEVKRRFEDSKIPSASFTVGEFNGKVAYTLKFDRNFLVDSCTFFEDISDGDKIGEFTLYADAYGNLNSDFMTAVYRGFTVGRKRICTFPTIRCRALTVVLDKAEPEAKITEMFACYCGEKQIEA